MGTYYMTKKVAKTGANKGCPNVDALQLDQDESSDLAMNIGGEGRETEARLLLHRRFRLLPLNKKYL